MYYCTTYKNAFEEHLWLLVARREAIFSELRLFSVLRKAMITMIHNGDDWPPLYVQL